MKAIVPWRRSGSTRTFERGERIQYPKYKLRLLQEESIRKLYAYRLEEKLGVPRIESLSESYLHLKKCIHEAAGESFGEEESAFTRQEWWSEEVGALVREKKDAYRKWLRPIVMRTGLVSYRHAAAA